MSKTYLQSLWVTSEKSHIKDTYSIHLYIPIVQLKWYMFLCQTSNHRSQISPSNQGWLRSPDPLLGIHPWCHDGVSHKWKLPVFWKFNQLKREILHPGNWKKCEGGHTIYVLWFYVWDNFAARFCQSLLSLLTSIFVRTKNWMWNPLRMNQWACRISVICLSDDSQTQFLERKLQHTLHSPINNVPSCNCKFMYWSIDLRGTCWIKKQERTSKDTFPRPCGYRMSVMYELTQSKQAQT